MLNAKCGIKNAKLGNVGVIYFLFHLLFLFL